MADCKNSLCFKLESFGAVDGPGIRLVVFLQGCPMRCLYCHNPESWQFKNEDAWNVSVKKIIDEYENNKSYYSNGGGITVSGGEPTYHIDFLTNLAKETKKRGIHLTIDTSCFYWDKSPANTKKHQELAKLVDLWLIDIKSIDPVKCKYITGVDVNATGFIELLESMHKHYWVRHVLVPTITDDEASLTQLGIFLGKLKYMDKFEILPYHNMAVPKYQSLGLKYRLENIRPANKTDVSQAMEYIRKGFNQSKQAK